MRSTGFSSLAYFFWATLATFDGYHFAFGWLRLFIISVYPGLENFGLSCIGTNMRGTVQELNNASAFPKAKS